jgi:hypothetical protein
MVGVGTLTVTGRQTMTVAISMAGAGVLTITGTVAGPITTVYRFTGTLRPGWSGRLSGRRAATLGQLTGSIS